MTVGDPAVFAIESGITKAYERFGIRALGFFVIHVVGRSYGIHAPDATMLACSLDEVERRIARRGTHTAPFASEPVAENIATAFRSALYSDEPDESYFGIPLTEFSEFFSAESSDLIWAPDGDEAFDDGSYVLHFDVKDRVRLIALRSSEGYMPDRTTVRDVWLPAAEFYGILDQWSDAFKREWMGSPKISEGSDGADEGQGGEPREAV